MTRKVGVASRAGRGNIGALLGSKLHQHEAAPTQCGEPGHVKQLRWCFGYEEYRVPRTCDQPNGQPYGLH